MLQIVLIMIHNQSRLENYCSCMKEEIDQLQNTFDKILKSL